MLKTFNLFTFFYVENRYDMAHIWQESGVNHKLSGNIIFILFKQNVFKDA